MKPNYEFQIAQRGMRRYKWPWRKGVRLSKVFAAHDEWGTGGLIVTHLPSGYRVVGCLTLRQAGLVVKLLTTRFKANAWQFKNGRHFPKQMREEARAALQKLLKREFL